MATIDVNTARNREIGKACQHVYLNYIVTNNTEIIQNREATDLQEKAEKWGGGDVMTMQTEFVLMIAI
jgi:hypothetical protein